MKGRLKIPVRKSSFTRDRLTMLAVLLTVIAIVICSMHVSRRISLGKLRDAALTESQMQAVGLQDIAASIFLSGEWAMNSFLCNFGDVTQVAVGDTFYYRHSVSDKVISELTAEGIGRSLESFVSYNDDLLSAVFILEPGVVPALPEGLAVSVSDSTGGWTDLEKSHHIREDAFYRRVKESLFPVTESTFIGRFRARAYTYAVNLYDGRGRFIGEFWTDTKTSGISRILKSHKTSDDYYVGIISKDGVIVSCSESEFNGVEMKDMLEEIFHRRVGRGWYERTLRTINGTESGIMETELEEGGAISWFSSIPGTGLVILIAKSTDKLFSKTRDFLRTQALVNLVTTLTIVLLLVPVFLRFKKENDANRRMKSELDVAASIQSGILPPNPGADGIPGVDIYGFQRQAKSVGGDLYDWTVKDGKLHFCIGDVSGKGIPAALMMTQICSIYRNIIKNVDDPAETVCILNDADTGREKDKMFCTMFAGVMDLSGGRIEFCNAGHNPPIVCRKADGGVSFLKTDSNIPVFAFEGFKYTKGTLELRRGDKLILYTDGVTEARNGDSFFGDAATLEAVSAHAGADNESLVRSLLGKIQSFAGTAPQHDDITILCIKYKGYENNN